MAKNTPELVVIVDRSVAGSQAAFVRVLRRLADDLPTDGRVWVQLRCKGVEHALFDVAAELAALRMPVLVNGDEALARRVGGSGVHWPETKIPDAPSHLLHRCASVHSLSAVRRAEAAGADCVLFSPVFAPRCKEGVGVGLDALALMAQSTSLPVLALGGITPQRASACRDAGAAGVAVLSPVLTEDFDWRHYVPC